MRGSECSHLGAVGQVPESTGSILERQSAAGSLYEPLTPLYPPNEDDVLEGAENAMNP